MSVTISRRSVNLFGRSLSIASAALVMHIGWTAAAIPPEALSDENRVAVLERSIVPQA